ncbi:Proteasome subunit alpha type-3 [Diplonema papillatum]|nr:Proteasome subunit alpha type-3 [Diplonema papillatum]
MSSGDHDMDANVYSPDGMVFQVDYAIKAVDAEGTALGVCCKDGVVLGVEKLIISKMVDPKSNTRVYAIDRQAGCVIGGMLPDGRHLVSRLRDEVQNFRGLYGIPCPGEIASKKLCKYTHFFTISGYRPFGAALIIASYADDGPQLYLADPSGQRYSFHAVAIGKGKTLAKTELEKIDFSKISCREALDEIAKVLYAVHDDQKDKQFELEFAWVTDDTEKCFTRVPDDIAEAAKTKGKQAAEGIEKN